MVVNCPGGESSYNLLQNPVQAAHWGRGGAGDRKATKKVGLRGDISITLENNVCPINSKSVMADDYVLGNEKGEG